MDDDRFDSLARRLTHPASRRTTFALLASTVLSGAVPLAGLAAEAKRKRHKQCNPCQRKKKGKCRGAKPDGTSCGDDRICLGGQCVSSTCDPGCKPPETCVNGTCGCHSPAEACGDICCAQAMVCDEQGVCICEVVGRFDNWERLCSCPGDDFVCRTDGCGEFPCEQCCLDGDLCDKTDACVTETCSAGNSYCQTEFAFCGGTWEYCGCFTSTAGEQVCAESIDVLHGCPGTSNCTTDADCGDDICVNMSCCDPEGADFGVCLPRCEEDSGAERARGSRMELKRNRPRQRP